MNTYNSHTMAEKAKKPSIKLDSRSIALRKTIIQILESSRRGHLGSALSIVEILRVLYDDVLRFNPENPRWLKRDRFILSKGHGCLALYAILADKGFFPESEVGKFCQSDGLLGGHQEIKIPGVDASTGSLGHGISIGIGFALNAKHEKADYRSFVVISDGEADEGSTWEAALCASKHCLSNLTVIVDYNKQQSYDTTFNIQNLEPFAAKWKSFGFAVAEIDGHSVEELRAIFSKLPLQADKPNVIICHTVKGKGIHSVENNLAWHHRRGLTDAEIHTLYKELEVG